MVLECLDRPVVSDEEPFFRLLVNTGTPEKFRRLLEIFYKEKNVPAEKIEQFADAGQANESITPDSKFLIFGKQAAHREIFLNALKKDGRLRTKYGGKKVVTVLNDVNTTIDKRSLTKTKIQKENDLNDREYALVIRVSLKYLLAESNHLLTNEISWAKLTSDMEALEQFDKRVDSLFVPGRTYILPIDFQSIDAYEVLKIDTPMWGCPSIEQVGPSIAVLHKSFASLEFEVGNDGKMKGLDEAVEHYLWVTRQSSEKRKYRLDRCPLGIYWAALFNSMVVKGMNIHLSVVGHDEGGISLQEAYKEAMTHSILVDNAELSSAWKTYESPMESLEKRQDGFSGESNDLAMAIYREKVAKKNNEILFITCKPGQNPIYQWERRPKYLK